MKAEERAISQILTDQLRYFIPLYQRPYSWTTEHIQNLLDDVGEAFENKDEEYFIGSLITIERGADLGSEVVDGQQRLTTLNIIFARLREHLSDAAAKQEIGNRVLPRNPFTKQAERPRLAVRESERPFFRAHVLGAEALDSTTIAKLDAPKQRMAENMRVADKFFADRDQEWLNGFAYYLLSNVYVVVVRTEHFQSAYRLFNVLNARGMSLSNADLFKADLLGRRPHDVDDLAELGALWTDLEETVGVDRLDTFLGLHRTAVTGEKARKGLADELKGLLANDQRSSRAILKDLLVSARNYVLIIEGNVEPVAERRALAALRRVSYDEWVPALLAYLNRPVQDLTTPEYLGLLERITMQNWVRRLGRSKRNTIYYRLITGINAGESAERVRQHFRDGANDEEFFSILDGEVYGYPYAQAVLLRLEEGAQDDSVTRTYGGRLSIEHVLPRSPKDPYWETRFSTREHQQWLHRLGNLTLLSGMKNVLARNYAFPAKRAVYLTHNATVSFDLTKEVCKAEEWTPAVLEARHARLMEVARGLWGMS